MKRTIENCGMIKMGVIELVGYAEIIDGKCGGYANLCLETHEECKKCEMYDSYMKRGANR